MLNKFQEQDLFSTVEQLEDIKKKINSFTVIFLNNSEEEECILKDIEKIISSLKNIHPSLFNYPEQAKYISGGFNSTIAESDGEE